MNIKTNDPEKNETALEGLFYVLDPEIGLNIVDLGLVYEIDFAEESKTINVNMTLTSQFCPMGETIMDSTTRSMQQSFPEYSIQVNLTFDPPWGPSMISLAGKEFLNM